MYRTIVSWVLCQLVAIGVVAAHDDDSHAAPDQPPWQEATGWPDRIVVTLPKAPQRSFAVTWRTDEHVESAVAQIVRATADARFDLGATVVRATTERLELQSFDAYDESIALEVNAGLAPVHYHSVTFDGLEPDTLYAYRVRGAKAQWSEWFQTRTAAEAAPITFLYFGDAQNAVRSHWSRVVRAGFQAAPEADFMLHAGDLVNLPSRDLEWAEWFDAVGFIHAMIPAVPLAGNHEYERLQLSNGERARLLSTLWRPQFTLPAAPTLDDDLQEVTYELRYSEALHLFVVSTQSPKIQEQADWLEGALAASDARWKLVAMHHPVFSSGAGRDSPDRRALLLPVLNKHKVDLVLQGHDHTYARGAIGQSPERVAVGANGVDIDTMFVNSVSGPKQYRFREGAWDAYESEGVRLLRRAENTQFFQVITIEGDRLAYAAYTAAGELYDDFTMSKAVDGTKRIVRGATSTMDERSFDNTGAYQNP